MSLIDKKHLDAIESGTKKQALAAAKAAGTEYQPLWFDYNDSNWEIALGYIRVEEDVEKRFPALSFDNFQGDFSEPFKEIHRAARENPIFAATEKGDVGLQKLKDTFQESCEETFDATVPVKELIKGIRQDLAVFLPILPGQDVSIPQMRFSGCDKESDEWKTFASWAKDHIIESESKYPLEKSLQELADNASYGGEPGLVVLLDGKDFLRWMEEKSIWPVIQGFGKTKASLAVYDFLNGSGHDIEGMAINWKAVTEPLASRAGIINNFIDAVFGLVGISKIYIPKPLPNSGSGCNSNIWF